MLGKAVSCMLSFGHIRTSLGPRTLPHQEIKNPHSLYWVITSCEIIFPCFRLNVYSFVLVRQICQWPSPMFPAFSISDPRGEGPRSFYCSRKWVNTAILPLLACCRVDPLAMGDRHTAKNWICALFLSSCYK